MLTKPYQIIVLVFLLLLNERPLIAVTNFQSFFQYIIPGVSLDNWLV